MDDLLALMEETPPSEEVPASTEASSSTEYRQVWERDSHHSVTRTASSRDKQHATVASSTTVTPTQQLCLNVDEKVGIRMIRRKVSSIDLMEMLVENPFYSTAALSAMSLAALNRTLVDPAAVLDPANVCGKTSLVTVGIVFSNSGTRVASSGNAFCVVTIGNLRTGAAVSALLFGSVYSQFCKTCVPGKVVALVCPRLIPPKAGSGAKDTAISFSLSDERQLKIVADARDFSLCKATMRGKRDDGQWVADAKRCKHFVDTRVGEYCQMHRNKAKTKSSAGAGGATTKGTTTMQQLRLDGSIFPSHAQGRTMSMPSSQGPIMKKPAPEPSRSDQMMSDFQSRSASSTNSNLRGVPLQMTKKQPTNKLLAPRNKVPSRPTGNPYLATQKAAPRAMTAPLLSRRVPRAVQPPPKSQPAPTNWLQGGATKKRGPLGNASAAGNKRRAVNLDTGGFNGSVAVPKAKMFAGGPTGQPMARARHDPRNQAIQRAGTQAEILSKQRALAAQMSTQRPKLASQPGVRQGMPKAGGARSKTSAVDSRQALRDSLFGTALTDAEKNKVVAQKSRFALEADAEDYARSRRIVSELEKEEDKKEYKESKQASKKKGSQASAGAASSIKTEWFCQSCRQSFSRKPLGCYKAGHPVKADRKIQRTKTIGEKRTTLSDKRADEGGLKLGSGIEWSRWNRFG